MTKLEIRERTGLSMTTVISSVEDLVARGLVTFREEKGAHGGKMRSVINLHPKRRVYGISYKSGVLTAVAADLRGEVRESLSRETEEGISPLSAVLSLALALRGKAPMPLGVSLSMNCEEKALIAEKLSERLGAEVITLSNTESVAHLVSWRGTLPVAAVGVGNRVKCVLNGMDGCRTLSVGDLASPVLITQEGSYLSALSAANVEETLRSSHYRGMRYAERGRVGEVRDLSDYSRALAATLASLVATLNVTLSPARVVLFGEYLSEAFFARIKEYYRVENLVYLSPEREDFALGAALAALRKWVFT